jgi:hypothetical protein
MGMKFINAKFFYNKNELIDENNYSYWWILMGNLKDYGSDLELASDASIKGDEWTELKGKESSYNVTGSSKVELKNAYICGIAGALAPVVEEDPNNMGNVVLTASGSKSNSIIPFTVGQDKSTVGHNADSLWLLALKKELNDDNVQNQLFPFVIDSDNSGNATTQKYAGPKYDISDSNNICIPLIGYNVSSDNAVNSINYSGFTVGSSVVTLSGLFSDTEKN